MQLERCEKPDRVNVTRHVSHDKGERRAPKRHQSHNLKLCDHVIIIILLLLLLAEQLRSGFLAPQNCLC
jgi:hypothetical protein